MIDDGDGDAAAMHERIFEPRVMSKLDSMHMDKWGIHGRGMALYPSRSTPRRLASSPLMRAAGAAPSDELLDKLGGEDRSIELPVFGSAPNRAHHVRGPKNILRTACEFAIECRHDCTVYLGSLTDIAARRCTPHSDCRRSPRLCARSAPMPRAAGGQALVGGQGIRRASRTRPRRWAGHPGAPHAVHPGRRDRAGLASR